MKPESGSNSGEEQIFKLETKRNRSERATSKECYLQKTKNYTESGTITSIKFIFKSKSIPSIRRVLTFYLISMLDDLKAH